MQAEFMSWASLLMVHMSQFAEDVIILNMQKCLNMSDAYCTGSSLMPQKKNPDVVELTRARAAMFPGWLNQVLMIGQLPSGYHRDYQLTKGPLFSALDAMAQMLEIAARLPESLRINEERCASAVTSDLLATHEAIAMVREGVPFRTAYREVAARARAAGPPRPVSNVELPSHLGAPGRPDWKFLAAENARRSKWSASTKTALERTWSNLVSGRQIR